MSADVSERKQKNFLLLELQYACLFTRKHICVNRRFTKRIYLEMGRKMPETSWRRMVQCHTFMAISGWKTRITIDKNILKTFLDSYAEIQVLVGTSTKVLFSPVGTRYKLIFAGLDVIYDAFCKL